jgi:chemosensory pili system protein ChpA (sensor histidine kinase/response regulator)
MDIVQARLQQMHGSVSIRSVTGAGTEILLRFQASLVTMHMLLVRVAGSVFAIPSHLVEMALPSDGLRVVDDTRGKRLEFADRSCACHRLADLLGMELPSDTIGATPALVLHRDAGSVAILVDELLDSQQHIVKDLGQHLQGLSGVLGAVVRADGAVAPVLDMHEWLNRLQRSPGEVAAVEHSSRGTVLVVDDTAAVRQSLVELLVDAGYEVATAQDGGQAMALIEASRPDVVVTDLEMPVLNGLDLTRALRSRPDTKELPVVMITSCATAMHRWLAQEVGVSEFMAKPFQDETLLQVVWNATAAARSALPVVHSAALAV